MGDKNVDDSDALFAITLIIICTAMISFLFGVWIANNTCIDSPYTTWEEHNIIDIIYYDDGIISGKYPVDGITKEIIIENGEVLGISIDMLSIGDVYNMHIYRDNYKGNNVAWVDACDNAVI